MKNLLVTIPCFVAASSIAIACGTYSDNKAAGAGAGGTTQGSGGANPTGSGGTAPANGGSGSSGATGGGNAMGGAGGSAGTGVSAMGGMGGADPGSGGASATAGTGMAGTGMGAGGVMPANGGGGGIGMAGRMNGGGMAGTSTGGRNDTGGGAGTSAMAGNSGSAGAPNTPETVCSVLAGAGNPCVAAHSTTRVLYPSYAGPLYQVCKGSSQPGPSSCPGGNTKDIGAVGGFADAATQDSFCSGGACTISIIYDQTPNGNNLKPAPKGGAKGSPDNPANAADLKTTLDGHAAYGVLIKPGMGYRSGCTGCEKSKATGTATGDQAETQYMVTSQLDLVDGCCFDYGNAETSCNDDGNGTMETVYFGGGVVWGTGSPGGHDNGPWVMGDLENGLYAGWENNQDQNISTNTPMKYNFVTAVVVGDVASQNSGKGRFALYGADSTTGNVKQLYDGIRPSKTGYVPMKKQGSIILGIGGDNSSGAGGRWYEGVMTTGAATLATVNAVQANIVAAKYGK